MMNININANQVDAQASRLEQLASEIKSKTISRLNGVIMNSRAAWEGEAAAYFDQKMTDGETYLEQSAAVLSDNASRLKQIAKQVRQAQEQARMNANR